MKEKDVRPELKKSLGSKDVIISLYSAFLRPHLEQCLYSWSLQFKGQIKKTQTVQQMVIKMIKELEKQLHEEKISKQELLRLEKRGFTGDVVTVFQNLKGSYREDRGTFSTQVHDRRRNNGSKLFQGKFYLVLRKYSPLREKTSTGTGFHKKR